MSLLQQYLPFTVLKLKCLTTKYSIVFPLQQYLPFTVLKLGDINKLYQNVLVSVATVLTVYGIETVSKYTEESEAKSCNSTYRLRY